MRLKLNLSLSENGPHTFGRFTVSLNESKTHHCTVSCSSISYFLDTSLNWMMHKSEVSFLLLKRCQIVAR